MIDWQPWAIGGLASGFAILGWFAREMWSAVKALRSDLDTLRVHLAQDYPNYDRMGDVMKPILTQLDRIEGALRQKVDKP